MARATLLALAAAIATPGTAIRLHPAATGESLPALAAAGRADAALALAWVDARERGPLHLVDEGECAALAAGDGETLAISPWLAGDLAWLTRFHAGHDAAAAAGVAGRVSPAALAAALTSPGTASSLARAFAPGQPPAAGGLAFLRDDLEPPRIDLVVLPGPPGDPGAAALVAARPLGRPLGRYVGRWTAGPARDGAGRDAAELAVRTAGGGFTVRDLRPEAAGRAAVAIPPVPPPLEVRLVYLTDLHSAYERYPRLLATVRRELGPDGLIVIGGDVFEGSDPLARRSRGRLDWELLAALRELAPVVWNLGNHDADLSDGGFAATVDRARGLGIAVISDLVGPDGAPLAAPALTLDLPGWSLTLFGFAAADPEVYPTALRAGIAVSPAPPAPAGTPLVIVRHTGLAGLVRPLAAPAGTLVLDGHDHVRRDLLLDLDGEGPAPSARTLQAAGLAASIEVIACSPSGCVPAGERPLASEEDPDLALRLAAIRREFLTASDREPVGRVPRAMTLAEAQAFAAAAVARAAAADLAVLNHTSFGSGLEPGPLDRRGFARFLRFDNPIFAAEVDGRTLAAILAHAARAARGEGGGAGQGGDFVVASSALVPEPGRRYRLATSSWVAGKPEAYLGTAAVAFAPVAGATVRDAVLAALWP